MQTADGLLVPQDSQEKAAAAALQHHDPDLRLTWVDSDAYMRRVYRVIRRTGSEAVPFETVCVYQDGFGNPLPLSIGGLIDMVQRHDRNGRGSIPDPDAANARLVAERRRDAEYELDEHKREFVKRLDGKFSSPLPRSRGLHLARN